jgi:pyruvate dehydrogenase E2 component (dihydrolipoamide acetyltransferase)
MPQMGESIAEGTVSRWLKQIGETVGRDEPLLEISTDKVDAEIPSPVAGTLVEILVKQGEMAEVNSVIAIIEAAGGGSGAAKPAAAAPVASSAAPTSAPAPRSSGAAPPVESVFRGKASPTARVMARVNGLDLATVTARGSRITKADVERTLGGGSKPAVSTSLSVGPGDTVEPMSVMRKKIAQHMIESRHTSAHVYSVFLVDCGKVEEWRKARKAQYEARGVKVSILPFVAAAAVRALKDFPLLNASLVGDQVIYRGHINMGVAVALDSGLIVPVLKDADKLTVVEIARAIADMATRARNKQLKPEEVTGGTFTVTNPGNFGGSFATPIINQPQVAILELGTVEKKPAVVNDQIAVRPMMNLTLGFDHRLIDGALADQYLSAVKASLENWNEE